MFFIGVDLHKRTLSVCVMVQEDSQRRVVARQTLGTAAPATIVEFLRHWTPFQLVVEASASHEWFLQLVEPALYKNGGNFFANLTLQSFGCSGWPVIVNFVWPSLDSVPGRSLYSFPCAPLGLP